MRALVIGAGLAGLAAAERLLDHGAHVTVVDSFPVPGGRTASFDVPVPVAGLVPGDVVEHGLHAWFQHYHALFALMERAGVKKPPFAGRGVHLWNAERGHVRIDGGPLLWLVNALRLPEPLRGKRSPALAAFGRLIAHLAPALADPATADRETAQAVFERFGVPNEAVRYVFGPCLYSLTSLRVSELSALEMLRWMSNILPDPRIRCLEGGGTRAMAAPISRYLREKGADFRLGVEVKRLALGRNGFIDVRFAEAPDRTGVRHVLVQGFRPDALPDPRGFDSVVSTLPWERLVEVTERDPTLIGRKVGADPTKLSNVHPLTIRLWFERPIHDAESHYVLSSGTLFDVLRPTPEPHRYDGVRLIDALVENIDTHLPELRYDGERFLTDGDVRRRIVERVTGDLERLYPGQIAGNPVTRQFLHSREGIVACRPGAWTHRAPQYVGLPQFALAGDWTRQPWGICMEGAVRSGQLAVEALLSGRQPAPTPHAFGQVAYSLRSVFESA